MQTTLQKKTLVLEMIAHDSIMVTGTYVSFTEAVKQTLKLHGGVYSKECKGWVVPMLNYEQLHEDVC